MENILLKIWEEENGETYKVIRNRLVNIRERCAETLAWGIPNDEVLNEIGKYSPLIEIGAGLGYWARLLQDRGIRIKPTDISIPLIEDRWTRIYSGNAIFHLKNNRRNLFVCWVPEEIAQQAGEIFEGEYIIFAGEKINFPNFELVNNIPLPNWKGFTDSLQIFRRRR